VGLKCLADCWTERRRSSLWRGGATRKLGEPCFQEFAQLRAKLGLRNEIQFLERRGESVRETPDRPGSELLVLWLDPAEIVVPQIGWGCKKV
jgi:hypothetical protein